MMQSRSKNSTRDKGSYPITSFPITTKRAAYLQVLGLLDSNPDPADPYCGPDIISIQPSTKQEFDHEPPLTTEQQSFLLAMRQHKGNMLLTGPSGSGKVPLNNFFFVVFPSLLMMKLLIVHDGRLMQTRLLKAYLSDATIATRAVTSISSLAGAHDQVLFYHDVYIV
jgi:hypothetical protein